MRKRNRQNSVRSDCLGGERVGVLIRRGSQTEESGMTASNARADNKQPSMELPQQVSLGTGAGQHFSTC
jgi:hypothetical protein